jgi:hypothetical protein
MKWMACILYILFWASLTWAQSPQLHVRELPDRELAQLTQFQDPRAKPRLDLKPTAWHELGMSFLSGESELLAIVHHPEAVPVPRRRGRGTKPSGSAPSARPSS